MLNLLPPQYKKELRQEETRRLILILGIVFLLFLISLSLILFSIKIYIESRAEALRVLTDIEEKKFEDSEAQEIYQKILLADENISKMKLFYQDEEKVTIVFEEILKTMPSGLRLDSFSWKKETLQMTLSGFSPTWEILFEFKENLEKEKDFIEVYFPPSNWVKATDIDFNVSFKIRQHEYR